MTRKSDQIEYSQTERASGSVTPPPTKREYAVRKYLGIGPGGEPIEERTAEELADELDVSVRTIRRWCNEEPLPIVEDWSAQEKLTMYACVMTRDEEALVEYLKLRDLLEEQSESPIVETAGVGSPSEQSAEPESDPHPFDGLDEEFSPW